MESSSNGPHPDTDDIDNIAATSSGAFIDDMKKKLAGMDDDIAKLTHMTEESETHEGVDTAMDGNGTDDDNGEVNRRSVYVGNVDYGATPQELQDHFRSCGQINRITIMVDKYTGHPKGFAYVEFADPDSVKNAELLSDSIFRGRLIKVTPKRKNVPGFNRGSGRGRGRGYASRGRGGYYTPRGAFGYSPRYRGRFVRPRGPY